jgi:hypothetical protein
MGEVNIFFWGLICHVSITEETDRVDVAMLVQGDDHYPRILFGEEPENQYDLDLASTVTFKHGTESATIDATEIDQFVPRLQSILGGRLGVDKNSVIYFRYPKAVGSAPELSVFDVYPEMAEHISRLSSQVKRSERPVARVLRLRVQLDDAITAVFSTGGTKTEVEVPLDSCILVANIEDVHIIEAAMDLETAADQLNELALLAKRQSIESTVADYLANTANAIGSAAENFKRAATQKKPGNHFEHYSKLLAASDTCFAKPGKPFTGKLAEQPACKWVLDYLNDRIVVTSGTRPECGNTVYP